MVARIIRFLLLAALLAAALSIAFSNAQPVSVAILNSPPITTSLGISLLVSFALGLGLASLGSMYYGVKSKIKQSVLKRREAVQRTAWENASIAQSHLLAGEYPQAVTILSNIVSKLPLHAAARGLLSDALVRNGEVAQANAAIDEGRRLDRTNLELLYRAAALHEQLGNKTVALDNLTLVLEQRPSEVALRKARDLSLALNRLEEAANFQRHLATVTRPAVADRNQEAVIELTRLKAHSDSPGTPTRNAQEVRDELKSLIKRYPDSPDILCALIDDELAVQHFEEALNLSTKLMRVIPEEAGWMQAADLRTTNALGGITDPQRALNLIQQALRNTGEGSLAHTSLQLHLVRVMLRQQMNEPARDLLQKIFENGKLSMRARQARDLAASLAIALGRTDLAQRILLSDAEEVTQELFMTPPDKKNVVGFAPRLSTP